MHLLWKILTWKRCRDLLTVSNMLALYQMAVGMSLIAQPTRGISPSLVRGFFVGWPVSPEVEHIGIVILLSGVLMIGRCMMGIDLFLYTIPVGIYGFIVSWETLFALLRGQPSASLLLLVVWWFPAFFTMGYISEHYRKATS